MKKIKIILSLIGFVLLCQTGFSQTDFFVKINPEDGSLTKIKKLPEIRPFFFWPDFDVDEVNNHYIFREFTNENYDSLSLNTIDITTGDIIFNPPFPTIRYWRDEVINLYFDNTDGKLYGLYHDDPQDLWYILSINQETGHYEYVTDLPDVINIGGISTYNDKDQWYILREHNVLQVVDMKTGHTIYRNPFSSNGLIYLLHYDNILEKLFALKKKDGTYHMVSIELATGIVHPLYDFPIEEINIFSHYSTYDETHHRYYFVGSASGNPNRLYCVDVLTGEILSNPLFPDFEDPDDRIKGLVYDNTSGNIYALHRDAHPDPNAPQVSASAEVSSGCSPLEVQFHAETQNTTHLLWEAPTGTPTTSTLTNPVFTFTTPGIHHITVTAGNDVESIVAALTIEVLPPPTASFQYEYDGDNVTLINTTQHATDVTWIFDDETPPITNQDSISFEFLTNEFAMTLLASGLCGEDSVRQIVSIPPDFSFKLYPNPTSNFVTFEILPIEKRDLHLTIYDSLGKQVFTKEWKDMNSKTFQENLILLPSACYFYRMMLKEKTVTGKIMVIH